MTLGYCEEYAQYKERIEDARQKNLTELNLSWWTNQADFSSLASLTNLTKLSLLFCTEITDIGFLSSLPKLTHLNLGFCSKIEDISPLSTLTNLKELDLRACNRIKDHSPIGNLKNLTYLDLQGNDSIKDFSILYSLTGLKKLDLSAFYKDEKDFSPLASLVNLTELDLRSNKYMRDLSPLVSLNKLSYLNLSDTCIENMKPLSLVHSLRRLELKDCKNLEDISFLSTLTNLTELNLYSCKKLKDISALSSLKKLKELKLRNCEGIQDYSALCYLSELNLEKLSLPHEIILEDVLPESSIISAHRDEWGRFHNEKGASVSYKEGLKLYYWHGVGIPKKWITERLPTVQEALRWWNIEQRRAACEMIGWDKIIEELNAKVIDENADPEIGSLLEVQLPDTRTRDRFLKVRCGTGRDFVIPVPPNMRTARQANAWTWGLEKDEYHPEVRT